MGGFGGKADRLNRYNVLTGDPGYLEQDLRRYREATAKSVNEWMRGFIDLEHRAVLYVVPQGTLKEADVAVDRTELPGSTGERDFTPPAIQTATLDNGLKLYLVEKHELPLVEVRLNVMRGWAADPAGKPGTAALIRRPSGRGRRWSGRPGDRGRDRGHRRPPAHRQLFRRDLRFAQRADQPAEAWDWI